MARRKKAEKIIAELRRKVRAREMSREIEEQGDMDKRVHVEVLKETKKSAESLIRNKELITFAYDFNFIKKDLLKTFLFSLIVIGFELFLYWALRVNGTKYFQNLLPKNIF